MSGTRPMRADARRNYERLLSAAVELLEETGADASLEELARRVGVGIGTVYRHFPTRDALLQAVLHARFEALNARAEQLLAEPDADRALLAWLRELATQSALYRGLTATLVAAIRDEGSALHASCRGLHDGGRALFERARADGRIRADVDASDVFSAAYSFAFVLEQEEPEHRARRLENLLGLLADGIRPAR